MSTPCPLQASLRLLIRANHILHQHSLVDAFGHISVRHPLEPTQYLLAAYDPGAPALVKCAADFISYHIHDSSPVDASAPQGYSERYIHGELYKEFDDVMSVVHSHSSAVVPFTLAGVGVRPVVHMAGFLGAGALPVFDMEEAYEEADDDDDYQPDLLVKNQHLGHALATRFSDEQPVVLMHKHGFTTVGRSVQEAVYRALYTQTNCELLATAVALQGGDASRVRYLSGKEARACRVMNEKCLDKSFRLWAREVQVNPLYETEEGEPERMKVAGMKV